MPKNSATATRRKKKTDLDIQRIEELLLKERALLTDERARLRNRTSDVGVSLPFDEAGDVEEGTVDLSNYLMDKELNAQMEESLDDTLRDIELALRKIKEGTYGFCDICKKKIPKARLEALPHATLCTECQSLVEDY